jgi:hypothetical protein
MKRYVIMALIIITSMNVLYAADSKEKEESVPLPQSSYTIRKSSTDNSFHIMAVPLYVQITGKSFMNIGAGLRMEVNAFDRIGLDIGGLKSYFSSSFDTDKYKPIESKVSFYQIETGIKYYFLAETNLKGRTQVGIGDEMIGANMWRSYYIECEAPVKSLFAVRGGYIRNASSYTYVASDTTSTITERKTGIYDMVYAGFEFDRLYKIEVEINDVVIEKRFGKFFKSQQNFKVFVDALMVARESGEEKKESAFGFRAGLASWGDHWGLAGRAEAGKSPSVGWYCLAEVGICY